MCRRLNKASVSVKYYFNVVFGLVFFCPWYSLCLYKQTENPQTPRVPGPAVKQHSHFSHVKLRVLRWCCTVIALLLHLHMQVKGNYISNTSGQRQGHGNFAFAFTVYTSTPKPAVTPRQIHHI